MSEILKGRDAIAEFFGWSLAKFHRYKRELKAAGVIFRMRVGSPPKLTWCASRTTLLTWLNAKAEKGECL